MCSTQCVGPNIACGTEVQARELVWFSHISFYLIFIVLESLVQNWACNDCQQVQGSTPRAACSHVTIRL